MSETIKISLSTALMRRKELMSKVNMLEKISIGAFFELRVKRNLVHEGLDQVEGMIPKLKREQVEQESNYYSHQLRLLDRAIQQANHTIMCDIAGSVMDDFVSINPDEKPGHITESLASLLTRRKYLDEKVKESFSLQLDDLFVKISERVKAEDSIKELLESSKTMTAGEAIAKPAYYARQLRLCEDKIHATNSQSRVEVHASVMEDFAA